MRKLNIKSIGGLAAGILFLAGMALADEPDAKTVFIKNGTVYTITHGIIRDGCILVEDGKIKKVGINLPVPEKAHIINAQNKWILPGFIAVQTNIIGLAGNPNAQKPNEKFAHFLNPYDEQIQLCLASGITTFSPNNSRSFPYSYYILGLTPPKQKSYSFQNAIIKPTYGNLEDMLIKEPAYIYIDIAQMTASEKSELRGYFHRARDFLLQEGEYEKTKEISKKPPPRVPFDLTHYVAILKKEMPVRFSTQTKDNILAAIAFVDEFDVRGQLFNAAEGWLIPTEIGLRNIEVIVQPRTDIAPDPILPDESGSHIRNAAILSQHGVKILLLPTDLSIRPGGQIGTDLLTFPLAGTFAIRGGLSEKEALEAITIRPAEMLGISHRVGSIEEGKDADIIILDGNPFDYKTYVEFTLINGKVLYNKSKSPLFQKIPKSKRLE